MIYNYQDADGYERGLMGKGLPKVKRIYSLRFMDISRGTAHVQSVDIWGAIFDEVFPIHTITPLEKEIIR